MASIKDVVKEAGVGVGTVSGAINNTGYVAPATRKKIDKAVEKLNGTIVADSTPGNGTIFTLFSR